MREEEIVTGIVLYATLVGEYDKRLVVLTKERGKITIFANGARRVNSQFCAASQSFVMGKFTVRPTRDAYNLLKAEIMEYFSDIPKDMEKLCYASYFTELMSYYTREGDKSVDNLNLLYVTLKVLVEGKLSAQLIKSIYQLRLMDIEGEGIHAYACVKCGSKDELDGFNAAAGGFLCSECMKPLSKESATRKISGTLIYTVQYILSAPLGRLYAFSLKPEALKELLEVSDSFLKQYVDRHFNSLDILDSLS